MTSRQFWRGRRVLVTGHAGFKGSWLTLWLERLGAEVTGLGGRAASQPAPDSLFAQARVADGIAGSLAGDVRNPADVDAAVRHARAQVVFHLAAVANFQRSLREPVDTYATNVMGTVHVLDAIRRLGDDVRAVITVSSDKCYVNREWERPYREDNPLGGKDPYSSSKACQELVTGAYRDSFYAGRDVRVATVRAGNVVGGGDWTPHRLVPDLVRAGLAGAPLHVRAPDAVRPWQHVLNPLQGYLQLAEALCGDGGRDMATAWNFGPADVERRAVRWIVDYLNARWPGGVDVRFGTDDEAEAGIMQLDSSRARSRLGWAPPWDLAAGLDATVDWYLRRSDGEDARSLCEEQIDAHTGASRARSRQQAL